ncbi:MAG: septum formation protein Maf [Calothrix sp. SM1_5_4]|nr:septum formation protein Maf [Calothrix sp. SM1_5_4]
MLKLVLASQSPRRRELLYGAGYEVRVSPVKVSEIFDESLNPEVVASYLATVKAEACLDQYNDLKSNGFLVLGADTIVVLGDQILNKPRDKGEAREFLSQLSFKTHRVITGMTLLETGSDRRRWSGVEVTEVTFRRLTAEEIEAYIATGEPMDKAGAYGIQGEGGKFVSSTAGSWSNVVGLPLERLEKVLRENGWSVGRRASK